MNFHKNENQISLYEEKLRGFMKRVISIKTVSRDTSDVSDAIMYVVMVNKETYSVQVSKAFNLLVTKKGVCSYLNLKRKELSYKDLMFTMTIDGVTHISTCLYDTHMDKTRESHRRTIKDYINILDTTQ